MNTNKIITVVGIAFMLMWVIQATYLVQYFPFSKETKDKSQQFAKEATQLPESLKRGSVLESKTSEILQNKIETALKLYWVINLALIVCGIVIGCLLTLHKTMGYLLGLLFSLGLIFHKFFSFYNMGEHRFEGYTLFFKYHPLAVIWELIMILVLLITIFVLTSVYIGKIFKRTESRKIES